MHSKNRRCYEKEKKGWVNANTHLPSGLLPVTGQNSGHAVFPKRSIPWKYFWVTGPFSGLGTYKYDIRITSVWVAAGHGNLHGNSCIGSRIREFTQESRRQELRQQCLETEQSNFLHSCIARSDNASKYTMI